MGVYVGVKYTYTPIEYIESSGTQYIDTGVKPTTTTKVEAKFALTSSTQEQYPSMFGCQGTGSSGNGCFKIRNYLGSNINFQPGDTSINSTVTTTVNTIYEVSCKYGELIVNNTTYTGTSTWTNLNANIYLFGSYNLEDSSVLSTTRTAGSIYYCKIYENNVLIRDFIPVLDDNEVACLYDLVEGKFYYNKGTGTFSYGTTGTPVVQDVARRIKKAYAGVKSTYTPVEYIESSRTQFIDTGVLANSNVRVEMEVSNLPAAGSAYQALFGGRTNYDGSDRVTMQLGNDNRYKFDYQGTVYTFPAGTDLTNRTLIVQDNNVATIGNQTITATASTFSCPYTIYLFALNNGGAVYDKAAFRLYSCKIYSDGVTLARDFVPAVDSSGVACLWEKVEQKPYYNNAFGPFLYPAPNTNDYDVLEYIESSGTQYLDIGFYANNNTRVEAEAMPTDIANSEPWQCLFSSKTSYQNSEYVVQIKKSETKWYTAYGAANQVFLAVTNNCSYFIDKNKNITTINGTVNTLTTSTFTSTQPMYIFADNESGPTHYFKGKLSWLKVYDNGTLIRNLVPVKRKIDDEICMYDLVNNQFYTNAGTGTFVGGSVAGARGTPVEKIVAARISKGYVGVKATYTPVEYIESSGTQYIDTGVPITTDLTVDCKWASTGTTNGLNGTYTDESGIGIRCLCFGDYNGVIYQGIGSSRVYNISSTLNTEYITTTTASSMQTTSGGSVIASVSGSLLAKNVNFFLCCASDVNNTTHYFAKEKIYYCKLYKNGVLIRDFIPVLEENGVACLWEKVESRPYYNNGTGTFAAGSATGEPDIADISRARQIFRSSQLITPSTINNWFGVANSSQYFVGDGTGLYKSNNNGINSSTAQTILTAKYSVNVSFQYRVSSEQNYDKLTITVGGTTVANGISGTSSGSWSGRVAAGQTITFKYAKDGSGASGDDRGYFWNMIAS